MTNFSIIIPVFNASLYLEFAIESVIKQKVKDWELILINDNSIDNSLELIQGFKKKNKRIRVIDLKYNKGSGYCRNIAIQQARGDFIVFLDADDFLISNALERAQRAITKKPNTKVLVWGFYLCDKKGKPKKEFIPHKPNKKKGETHFRLGLVRRKGFYAYPWIYIVKRDFIKKHNLRFTEGIFFQDIQFTMQALYFAKRVNIIPKACVYYRKHFNSVTGHSSVKKIYDKFTAHENIRNFLIERNTFGYYQMEYKLGFLTFCLFNCFKDYFSLSKKHRDQELDQYMKKIRSSKLLKRENLLLIRNIGLSLDKRKEKTTRKFYLTAYAGLSGIKKRYWLQSNLMRFFIRLKE